MSELPQVEVTFTRSEVVFRHVVRVRLRIPTRRQQRLAARRAGTAHSFKREWKSEIEGRNGVCLPIAYETFARSARFLRMTMKTENLQSPSPSTAG